MLNVESRPQIPKQISPTDIPPAAQLVPEHLDSQWDIDVDLGRQKTGVTLYPDIHIGARKSPGVELSRIGRQCDSRTIERNHILDIERGPKRPGVGIPVNQAQLLEFGKILLRKHALRRVAVGRVSVKRHERRREAESPGGPKSRAAPKLDLRGFVLASITGFRRCIYLIR